MATTVKAGFPETCTYYCTQEHHTLKCENARRLKAPAGVDREEGSMTRIHVEYSSGQFWWDKCFDPDCQADRHMTVSWWGFLVFRADAFISGHVQKVLRQFHTEEE